MTSKKIAFEDEKDVIDFTQEEEEVEEESEDENDNQGLDFISVVQGMLTNDDGEHIVDVLSNINKQLAQQNKILMKLGQVISSKDN